MLLGICHVELIVQQNRQDNVQHNILIIKSFNESFQTKNGYSSDSGLIMQLLIIDQKCHTMAGSCFSNVRK